jgi:predicted RNase H-like nuclease (RuvC/YqgF family)
MKNKILTLVVIGFTAGVVLAGCQNKGEQNSKLTQDSLAQAGVDSQAVKTTYSEDWQNFKSESEQKIKENENSIAAFKEKMKKSGKKVKAGYKKEVANLEETNRQMKKKLEEYKNDGKSTWADFKAGFNKDMDKLGKAVKDLTSDND